MTDKVDLAFEITKITAHTGIKAMTKALNCCEPVALTMLMDYLLLVCLTKAPEQTVEFFNLLAAEAAGQVDGDDVCKALDRLHEALHLAETSETLVH